MSDTVIFLATIPTLQSAIQVSGGDGVRLKLEIPETEIAAAVRLVLLRGKVLRVTMEVVEDDGAQS